MAKRTGFKNPTNVSPPQKTGTDYGVWYNTDNLKEVDGSAQYRVSSASGSYTKPSVIKTRAYGFKIPECADIKIVHIRDAHWNATVSSETAYPRVEAVKHEIMSNSTSVVSHLNKIYYKKGTYVTYDLNGTKLTPKQINNNNFGLNISFGSNKNYNNGRFYLKIAQIDVEYDVPSYKIGGILKSAKAELNKVFDVEFNIQNTNKTSHNPNITIDLPNGVEFLGKKEGDGTIAQTGSTLTWNSQINNTITNRKIILSFKSNERGNKEFLLHAKTTDQHVVVNTSFNLEIVGDSVDVNFNTEIPTKYNVNNEFKFEINYNASNLMGDKCSVYFETENAQLKDYISKGASNNIIFDDLDNVIRLDFEVSKGRTGNIEIKINHSSEGSIPLKIYYVQMKDGVIKVEKIFFNDTIAFIDTNKIRGIFYKLNPTQLSRMGNEVTYEVSSYIWNSRPQETQDLGYNLRLGIFNDELAPATTDEQILKNILNSPSLIQCSDDQFPRFDPTSTENYIEQTVHFQYNEEYPVYIVFFLDYSCTSGQIQMSSPTVIEYSEKENNDPSCEFPALNQIAGLNYEIPPNNSSNAIRLYDFKLGEDEEEQYIVGYLMRYLFNYNIDETHPIVDFTALIGDLTMDSEFEDYISQSTMWGEETDEDDIIETLFWKELGGIQDKWKLNSNSRKISNLEELMFDFYFLNQGTQPINFNLDDFQFIVNLIKDSDDDIRIKINGEDLNSYGATVTNIKLPYGVKTENKYIDEIITDKHTPYLMTVDKNEIEIEFAVEGCDLEESSQMLTHIAHLFNNERDEMNKPKTNDLELSFLPNKVFKFVTEENIDADLEISNYNCKAKLILVDGTYQNLNPTLTLEHGFNNGISNVKPLIVLTDLEIYFEEETASVGTDYYTFEISDTITEANFTVNDFKSLMISKAQEIYGEGNDLTAEELLKSCELWIDCEERECYLKIKEDYNNSEEEEETPVIDDDDEENIIDLLQYVDYSSDWFSLANEYNFVIDTKNARIKKVSYYERG